MSAIRCLAARRAPLFAAQRVQRAAFHQSGVRMAGKESALGTCGVLSFCRCCTPDEFLGKGGWWAYQLHGLIISALERFP